MSADSASRRRIAQALLASRGRHLQDGSRESSNTARVNRTSSLMLVAHTDGEQGDPCRGSMRIFRTRDGERLAPGCAMWTRWLLHCGSWTN